MPTPTFAYLDPLTLHLIEGLPVEAVDLRTGRRFRVRLEPADVPGQPETGFSPDRRAS